MSAFHKGPFRIQSQESHGQTNKIWSFLREPFNETNGTKGILQYWFQKWHDSARAEAVSKEIDAKIWGSKNVNNIEYSENNILINHERRTVNRQNSS